MYAGLFTIITIITRSSMYYFWTVDKTFLSLSLSFASTMYSRQDHDGKNMHESVVYTISIELFVSTVEIGQSSNIKVDLLL